MTLCSYFQECASHNEKCIDADYIYSCRHLEDNFRTRLKIGNLVYASLFDDEVRTEQIIHARMREVGKDRAVSAE